MCTMISLYILLVLITYSNQAEFEGVHYGAENIADVVNTLMGHLHEKDDVINMLVQKVNLLESKLADVLKLNEEQLQKYEASLLNVVKTTDEQIGLCEKRIIGLTETVKAQANVMAEYREKIDEMIECSERLTDDSRNEEVPRKTNESPVSIEAMSQSRSRDKIQETHSIMKRRPVPHAGFLAVLTNDKMLLGVNQNIVFDKVITNDGQAYNPHIGVFVAPAAGTYVFSATVVSNNTDLTFVMNGAMVSKMFVVGSHGGPDYHTSSQTIVLLMEQGDELVIRNVNSDEHIRGDYYSSFSGFFLNEFSGDAIVG